MKLYKLIGISLLASACCCIPKNKKKQAKYEWETQVEDAADNYETEETDWATEETAIEVVESTNWLETHKTSENRYWDLINTQLNIALDFEKSSLGGSAILSLKPHFYPQDSVVLDAQQLEIKSVKLGTTNCIFYQNNDSTLLIIKLPKQIAATQNVSLEITYATKPNIDEENDESKAIQSNQGYFFINADLQRPIPRQFWTQGETESNSRWFPTLDAPNQKHTQSITVTAPDTMVILSNGKLIKETSNATNKTKTATWVQTKPHAVYLTMLAAGNWAIINDKYKDKEVNYMVEKAYAPYAKTIFGNTPAMISFFSEYTGVEYPWDKYTQVVVRDFVSGAMENTSATVHMQALQHTPGQHADNTYEEYISHELFHQWFGDLVTAESWGNISLNESFATYGEYLWIKNHYGEPAADDLLADFYNGVNRWGSHVGQPLQRVEYQTNDEVFDAVSYQKGALVLHMLNNHLGEKAFREGIKKYLNDFAYKNAEISDLKKCLEEVSGLDLSHFFTQWYERPTMPKYYVNIFPFEANNYEVHISQEEGNEFFAFANLDIWYGTAEGKTIKDIIPITSNYVHYTLKNKPTWLVIDPERKQLGDFFYERSADENPFDNIYQSYRNCKSPSRKSTFLEQFKELKENGDLSESSHVDFNLTAYEVEMIKEAIESKSINLVNNTFSTYFNYFSFDTSLVHAIGATYFKNIALNTSYSSSTRAQCMQVAHAVDTSTQWLLPLLNDKSNAVSTKAINLLTNPIQILELSKKGIASTEINVAKEWFVKNLYANPTLPQLAWYQKLMAHPFSSELIFGNLEFLLANAVSASEAESFVNMWIQNNQKPMLEGFLNGLKLISSQDGEKIANLDQLIDKIEAYMLIN